MSVSTAAFYKAIVTAWKNSGLDDLFKALWSDPTSTEYLVLNDQLALGGQPFPFCVMEVVSPTTTDRMSGGVHALREIRDITVNFNLHARDVDGDTRTNKEIAAYLAEEVMKVFGGHPTQSPSAVIQLENGNHLITRYDNDYSIRTGDEETQWVLVFTFRIDTPVAV